MPAIKVENLTKKFGKVTAIDNISFQVEEGELFGLLGPNGAGKTTTINMLSTIIRPTSGNATVAQFDIVKQRHDLRQNIGIVFQDPALDNKLTGRENLEFHSMIYGLKKQEMKERIKEVLDLVELQDKADILVEKYSGGMKRRLEIARGLIHYPKVLFLDEPTLGLDAQTRRHIWEYIKKLNKSKKVTIILTTHYMEEADFLCDRIAIIDAGKIVALDTPSKLKDILGGDIINMKIDGDKKKFMDYLNQFSWIKKAVERDDHVSITTEKGETKIPNLVTIAAKLGAHVLSVTLNKPSLEDVFIHFTGKAIRDNESNGHFDPHAEMMKRRNR